MKKLICVLAMLAAFNSLTAFADTTQARPSQRLAEGDSCSTPATSQTPTVVDECPNDPEKTNPGICGCGYPDTDRDGDGTVDCMDYCPDDPDKTQPGICGCNVPDDTPNCDPPCTKEPPSDWCPDDPDKTDPGLCGCGFPDEDRDGDGTVDCLDYCPDDPDKTEAGDCGCGVPDDTPGCGASGGTVEEDECPDDPDKTEPGECGCGQADTDSDADGTADCIDSCPNDPDKTEAGDCGCGYADEDRDDDGTSDCLDYCPDDPDKTEAGVCGCGIPDDAPDCKLPCSPTPTPTTTPTVEPTCQFYKGSIGTTGKWRGGNGSSIGNDEAISTDDGAASLTCLQDKIQDIVNRCQPKCQRNSWLKNYCDDCLASGIAKEFKLGESGRCNHWETLHNLTGVNGLWACTSGNFYFDNACNAVSNQDFSNVCGNVDVKFVLTCPISLLWEHDYNVNSNQTLANFKLDPTSADSWTAWKASEKAPLLVLDPEHKGVVSDASQLFGNWTFGGKRSASLAGNKVSASKWANGYEALATLDADGNGKVDGSELKDLALWFDANQNGISEAGEVKSVADMNITALYYKGYAKDALSEDLRLEVGYERNVDGRIVKGASVDWYAETAESKKDLANFYGYLRGDLSADEAPALASNVSNQLTGAWKWYLDDDAMGADVNDGMFLLSEAEGKVSGYTFAERRIVSSPNNAMSSMGALNRVIGTHTVKAGKDVFSFSSSNDKMTLKNVAVLSANGTELTGRTSVKAASGAEVLTYTWKAVRM